MELAHDLINWQKTHGRHGLPWQDQRNPYLIWVSEIMLQQTQVTTVIPYFNRFVARFPDIATLANASEEDVLTYWAGLGYYARGRNLHKAAQEIACEHGGVFPNRIDDIAALPGIGRSTAAAIAVFAFGERAAILDGNVKRVLTRLFAIDGWPGKKEIESKLWKLAAGLLPQRDIEIYTQGLMDLGATVCTRNRPACGACPLQTACRGFGNGNPTAYPTARPGRKLPDRHAQMLIIRHGSEVLLEKRPSPGIWGGLWCLPQAEEKADLRGLCLNLTGSLPVSVTPLPGLTHTFTHFRLHIQPREVILKKVPHRTTEANLIWLPIEDAIGAAIPKPVSRLLASLQ